MKIKILKKIILIILSLWVWAKKIVVANKKQLVSLNKTLIDPMSLNFTHFKITLKNVILD